MRIGKIKAMENGKSLFKMKRVTRQLFDGEIYAFESTVPRDPEYWKAQEGIDEIEEYIRSKLLDEDAEMLKRLDGLRLDVGEINNYALFDYGFCLGVRMMCDVFYGMGENQREEGE